MSKKEQFQLMLQTGATRIQNNKIISPITQALMAAMPITIVGAIGSLINSAPIPAYQEFLVKSQLKTITQIPSEITTNLLALYIVFLVASKYAQQRQVEPTTAGLLALMSFFIITPFNYSETGGMESYGIRWLGAAGLFTAFILGISVSAIYCVFRTKGWVFKMPEGVPPTIASSFAGLVPGFVIALSAMIIRYLLSLTSFGHLHQMIFTLIASPLTSLGGSFIAIVICVLVSQLLWLVGVHGSLVVYSVMAPIWTPILAANLAAFNAGQPIPHLVSMSIFAMSSFAGGGITIGLVFAMLRAKSEQYRTLGKLALVPNLVGINEPVIFGLPLVMNLTMAVPFVLVPLLVTISCYLAMVTGFLPRIPGINAPLGTPIVLHGALMGATWKWGAFQLVMVILSYLVYHPFFKVLDNIAYAEEQAVTIEAVAGD